jgi:hypothetical protein
MTTSITHHRPNRTPDHTPDHTNCHNQGQPDPRTTEAFS